MFVIYTGKPGSGKTLIMAREVVRVLKRNKRYFDKTGVKRKLYLNIKVKLGALAVPSYAEDFIEYWSDTAQLTKLYDVDVFWDELPTELDSTEWANMSLELKRWLQQHRKRGIEIRGTAQEFKQVDISARRIVSRVFWLSKLIGSADPSPTRPIPKFVWGLIVKRDVDLLDYDESSSKSRVGGIPSFLIFDKRDVDVFDTREEISIGLYPALRHIERKCEVCGYKRIIHK